MIDEEILRNFIEDGISQRKIAKELGCHQSTIRHWLKKYGLKTKKDCYKNRLKFYCKFCNETDPNKFYIKPGGRCKRCSLIKDKERRRKYKQEAVNFYGGKCQKCGYNKCVVALEFHHPNSDEKANNFRKMRNWSFESKKEELDKCILVCANCHREIHEEGWSIFGSS